MTPEVHARIQLNIFEHGPLRAVRLLTCSEFSVEHMDGYAYVVSDRRVSEEGPIQSVELHNVEGQGIATDFRVLKSFVLFQGPHDLNEDGASLQPVEDILETREGEPV